MQRSYYANAERKEEEEKEACLFWRNFWEDSRVVYVLLSVLIVGVDNRAHYAYLRSNVSTKNRIGNIMRTMMKVYFLFLSDRLN
jgi:hypothetical protein